MRGVNGTQINAILIVEDDVRILAALANGLRRYGILPVEAATVVSAISKVHTNRTDACITDMQLPDGTGLDVIRAVRKENATARIVLMTGYGSLEVGALAIKAGADDVISKPATVPEILGRVLGTERSVPCVQTPSDERARWEHMQRVLADCGGNRSEAARKLRVDRGTLHRWLDRPAPR